jgi:SAM-dependent methyltransferase
MLGRFGNKMVVVAQRKVGADLEAGVILRSDWTTMISKGHGVSNRVGRALMGVGRRHLLVLHPLWMHLKRAVFRLRFRSTEARFDAIYRGNHWRNPESASGFGSSMEATAVARSALAEIIARYSVTSILDIPCGDFNWMRHVDFEGSYCGADIVRDLVAVNQLRYGSDQRRFVVLDVISDSLPRSDLILCRDCLNHLSIDEAVRALTNVVASGSRYVLLTHYPMTKINRSQRSGFDYRPLNLERPPFNWPQPIGFWEEPREPGKTLALWKIPEPTT